MTGLRDFQHLNCRRCRDCATWDEFRSEAERHRRNIDRAVVVEVTVAVVVAVVAVLVFA